MIYTKYISSKILVKHHIFDECKEPNIKTHFENSRYFVNVVLSKSAPDNVPNLVTKIEFIRKRPGERKEFLLCDFTKEKIQRSSDLARFFYPLFILSFKKAFDSLRLFSIPRGEVGILLEEQLEKIRDNFYPTKNLIDDIWYGLMQYYPDRKRPSRQKERSAGKIDRDSNSITNFFNTGFEIAYLFCFCGQTSESKCRAWYLNVPSYRIRYYLEVKNKHLPIPKLLLYNLLRRYFCGTKIDRRYDLDKYPPEVIKITSLKNIAFFVILLVFILFSGGLFLKYLRFTKHNLDYKIGLSYYQRHDFVNAEKYLIDLCYVSKLGKVNADSCYYLSKIYYESDIYKNKSIKPLIFLLYRYSNHPSRVEADKMLKNVSEYLRNNSAYTGDIFVDSRKIEGLYRNTKKGILITTHMSDKGGFTSICMDTYKREVLEMKFRIEEDIFKVQKKCDWKNKSRGNCILCWDLPSRNYKSKKLAKISIVYENGNIYNDKYYMPYCGDGICSRNFVEDHFNCFKDCYKNDFPIDGVCSRGEPEDSPDCKADYKALPVQEVCNGRDDDDDGEIDEGNLCHNDYSQDPNDADGDGLIDSKDNDRDGDGVPNLKDAYPDDATDWADSDGDGIGDNKEDDADNDGIDDYDDKYPTNPEKR